MDIQFHAMPTQEVRTFQQGGLDANGQSPEQSVSDGLGNPCRHCLTDIPADEPMLVLAYRPFKSVQPYAEVGPIFLCGKQCAQYSDSALIPPVIRTRERVLIRGYDHHDRIVDGTGKVINTGDIHQAASDLFERHNLAYIHVRSASNNCFQCELRI